MAENKTKETGASVEKFLHGIDESKRGDCIALVSIMRQATGLAPKMWGGAIVGFGTHHYKYESGREGDICIVGFSPRKKNIALYVVGGFVRHDALLKKLGKHKTGKGCLYIDSIDVIDTGVLKKLIKTAVDGVPKSGE
jgi:hypothetical protein